MRIKHKIINRVNIFLDNWKCKLPTKIFTVKIYVDIITIFFMDMVLFSFKNKKKLKFNNHVS